MEIINLDSPITRDCQTASELVMQLHDESFIAVDIFIDSVVAIIVRLDSFYDFWEG